jgi:small subunit ribosomal protein S18
MAITKRVCQFCENKTLPSYTDSATLKRLLSDRSRIVPKMRTGTCSKHQRAVAREIKHARHLALLPFITKV